MTEYVFRGIAKAFASLDGRRLELVGPSVDDDVGRIIARYGLDAVRASIESRLKSKKRRGRPAESDMAELAPVFRDDARAWLAGRDPIAERSNYAIARDFAAKKPGHSQTATVRRVMKKLSAMRRAYILAYAAHESWECHPYPMHLRIVEALADYPDSGDWQKILQIRNDAVDQYRQQHGEPDASLSMKQVEDRIRNAMLRISDQTTGQMRAFAC